MKLAAVSLCMLGLCVGIASPAASQDAMNWQEARLREGATAAPMPEYPRASLEKKVTGVAVAAMVFSAEGRVEEVRVLEAPDTHIAAAVEQAVKGWVMTPPQIVGRPERRRSRSKLTFYFQVANGKGQVLNPDQMPGAIPRPERRPRPAAPPPGAGPAAALPAPPGVTQGGHGETLKTISATDLEKLATDARPIVLDVGDRDAFRRGHWPGAVNIPADELPMRAGPELSRSKGIAIDCTREELWRCRAAGSMLTQDKFSNVTLLVR